MADPRVEIGSLRLRVPGDGRDGQRRGRAIGEDLGSALADRLSPGTDRRLGALSLRVTVPAGAGPERVRAEVIAAIASALE